MAIDIEKAREHFMRSQFILNDIDEERKIVKGSSSEKEQKEKLKKIYLEWEKLEQQYMDYNLQILQSNDRISTANSILSPSRRPSTSVGSPSRRPSTSIGSIRSTSPQHRLAVNTTTRIGKVCFMLSPPPEFKHSSRTDRTVRKGTFHIQQLLFMYKVFTRSTTKTTYLHVYGVTSERNIYLRIKREYFDEVVDLELATLIFESSEDTHALLPLSDAYGVDLGYAVENAPILTGLSEMDDVADCNVTVYEEPFGYQSTPREMDDAIITGSWHVGGNDGTELLYRAFSIPSQTMVIVRDLSTKRKLFFTVYRSSFDEEEDMMIATYLFQTTGGKEPVKLQVHQDDDVQRIMKEYDNKPISSSVSVKLPQPLVTPIKRPATANVLGRIQTKPEAVSPAIAVSPRKIVVEERPVTASVLGTMQNKHDAVSSDQTPSPKKNVVEEQQSPPRRPMTSGSYRGNNNNTPSSSFGFVWSPKSKFSPLGSEESHATGKPDGSGSKPEKPFVTKETLSLVRNLLSGSNHNVHLYDPNLRFLAEQKSKITSNFNQYKTI